LSKNQKPKTKNQKPKHVRQNGDSMSKTPILLIIALFFTGPLLASDNIERLEALEGRERQIVQHIDQHLPQSINLLKQAVDINSGTMNFAGVKQVGMLFKAEFDGLGMDTQWIEGQAFGRAGHLQATHLSARPDAPKILLIGHLDTVFSKDDPFQTHSLLEGQEIAGPGITDMKGGDVIIIAALRALKELGLLERLSIKVVMTGDEEASGRPLALSKKALIDAAQWADIALGFEDGDGNIYTAVTSRRGSVNWALSVTGRPAHSSQIFSDEVGDGAIFEAARILNEFRVQLKDEALLSFNPGRIAGGTRVTEDEGSSSMNAFGKTNVVAKDLMVRGGIRAASPEQLTRAKQRMQHIVAQNLRHTSAVLTFAKGYPPMAQTGANVELLALYNQVSLDLGYNPVTAVNPRNAGAADISFAASHVDRALDGLGLMGRGGHTKEEVADMSSFAKNAHKTAILLYRLSK
jgi:glutamate carboxypeptidase